MKRFRFSHLFSVVVLALLVYVLGRVVDSRHRPFAGTGPLLGLPTAFADVPAPPGGGGSSGESGYGESGCGESGAAGECGSGESGCESGSCG